MAAFMDQVAERAEWSTSDVHCAGAQHEAVLVRQRDDLEKVLGLMPRRQRIAMLTRMVEVEILPRLAANARNLKAADRHAAPDVLTTEDDTLQLVRLLLNNDTADCIAFIETLLERGVTPAALYLGIISEAARRLGALWDEDRCHFADVTISMGRLQQVVRAIAPKFQAAALSRPQTDSILLCPAPGEQHSFGLVILSEFFLREGWHVVGGPISSKNDAAEIVRATWVDVIGFSISGSVRVPVLTSCIRDVRSASANTDIKVMVGGSLLLTQPGVLKEVGADAFATDAPGAVRVARGLLPARTVAR
jgi:MerR family transcriptional regulator, light-induced transcriptional regulator